jgi:cytoskeletal protein CcmA (bactofilin family)
MAFSGGTFSRTFDCTTDRDNGVKILASKFDTELDGMATGLSTCILKDGTQTCTAAIPFAEGLTVPDNKTIVLGTNSDITIQYDESTNDSLEIAANVEGAALGIVLKADQGDDNADQHKVNIADGGTLTMASKISGSFVSYLTHTPNSTVASSTTAVAGNLTVGGDLTLGSGAVISEAELEAIDGVTAGTVTASKAVIVDSNKDIASFRNVTLTGELDAGSLDVSGDADIDGTLETDALSINGTAVTATGAELNYSDTGAAVGTVVASKVVTADANKDVASFRNITLTGELDAGSLDVSGDADIDGTLEADAMTLNGTAITATATLDTGISNNNVPKFTSGVADNDFLRVDGTAIEGRSASEVLSDIAAAPAAGSSNIVTTGALNSGSITSGFGSIDNGSSAITTTGVITGGTLEATADTSAGDNAAIGYTAAEGLILTGQGSTSDITLKNDADATVFTVPTGTNDILFPDNAKAMFGASSDLHILACEDFSLTNPAVGENMITAAVDGAVTLYYDNAAKIATASTGVDVTGNLTATGTVSGASALSHRNLIINGAMQISTRGLSSVTSGYFLDRWLITSASATAQLTSSLPDGFGYGLSVSATSGNPIATQRIEAKNCKHLVGKNVTLSFYAKDLGNVAQLYASLGTANSEDDFSATTTISEQTLVADLPTSWNQYSYTWTLPANAANGIVLNILCAGSSTFTMGITGCQLEIGSQVTPFEHRTFADDLAACKRYFETSYPYGTAPGSASGGIGSDHRYVGRNTPQNYGWYSQRYTVEKRAAPTVTIFGYDGTSGQVSNGDDGSNIGAAGVIQNGTTGFLPRNESGGTLNEQAVIFLYSADAEL